MKLWLKVLIGLVLGVIAGAIFGPKAAYLRPIGDIFLALINMLVVLLVFSSMTVGITSIHDPKKLGRVGGKTLLIYLLTTAIAIVIGLVFGYVFKPGVGVTLPSSQPIQIQEAPKISELLLSIFPSNPVASLAQGDVLQIIVFSIFLGLAINFCGEKGKPLLRVIESLAEIMYRLTSIVMAFAPYGVFAIMASVAGTFGLKILIPLAKFLGTYYLACALHVILVFCGILWLFARLNPWPFFKGMSDAILVAASTNSSSATLPVTLHCVQENLGVSKNIASFVVPLGSTVNMNGTAMFQGLCTVFIAQAYGIHLGWSQLITILVIATLSAVGAAGIPGTGYIMLFVVLKAVGLPVEGLLIIAGIDRVREMVSTVLNILGDAVTAVYVAKTEGELDIDQYYNAELVGFEESDV
jgi:dicarboxylate/amino acid:cation (Na+ or H+) symporter, DAACS family